MSGSASASTKAPWFTAADDLMHDLSGAPFGRESLLWTAPLPDEGLLVFAYAWKTAATGKFGRFVAVAGDNGGKPLVLEAIDDVDLEGDDFDDCTIGGLRIRQPAPLQTAQLAFASENVEYEATFTGLHFPFSWHENEDGCAAWAATDRYEQSCRVTGRLKLGDREVVIDGHGHRDHSWGTRDWRALQHWKWINAAAGDDLSIHAWTSYALGDNQINGYINRGGVVTPLVDVQAKAQLDDRMLHETVTAVLTDADGGVVTLEAQRAAMWQMPIRHLYLNEAAMSGTLDGQKAVVHVELGWPQSYIDDYLDPEAV
ncbi:hypothetical protein DSM112329_04811 [Paraconexibacter sp. AEG42_29]|uniref:AttH domain-containing protein n=1 Tax=Paraconexibacter sp. AEG42_29 TaxID=2997339 RepID=A0AAU7B1N6_9ACTN